MELNLDIISEYLYSRYKIKRFGQPNSHCTLVSPMIYEENDTLEKEFLYIVGGDILPATLPDAEVSVICVGQRPSSAWIESGCPIIWIPDCTNLFSLFNEINRIFLKFNSWEKEIISKILYSVEFDIKDILLLGAKILENDLVVCDAKLQTLFDVCLIDHEDSSDFDVIINTQHALCVEIEPSIAAYRQSQAIRGSFFSSVPYMDKSTYCYNFFLRDRCIGCIAMTQNRHPFRKSDLAVANHFFPLFQKAYEKYFQSASFIESPKITAFHNLLNNIPLSIREQTYLSLNTDRDKHWLCFILSYQDAEKSMLIDDMCANLNALMSDTVVAAVHNKEIFGLLKIVHGPNGENDLNYFYGLIIETGYDAGLSSPYYDVNQTRIYLKLARFALEMGRKVSESNHVFCFETYILDYIITRYDGELSAEHLYPQGLRLLLEHDQKSSVNYIQTLRVYLENAMNIAKTAEALFLHRSSLLGRIENINKYLNMDLTDNKIRLYIQLCLYLLDKEGSA